MGASKVDHRQRQCKIASSIMAAVGPFPSVFSRLEDDQPCQKNEHRMGESAGKDQGGHPDQENHDSEDRPPGKQDRKWWQQNGENVMDSRQRI